MDRTGQIRGSRGRLREDLEDLQEPGQTSWAAPFFVGLSVVAAVVVLLIGAVAVFQLIHSEAIFPGVQVGDMSLGGMTRERALSLLQPLYAERADQPLSLTAPDKVRVMRQADLGATFDASAAVDAAYAVGRSGGWGERISAQLAALTRGHSVESPGLRVDHTKLAAYLTGVAREIDRPVKDAELVIGDDLSVRVTPSVVGRKLDVAAAAAAVEKAMAAGTASVPLPVAETQPKRVERNLEEARGTVTRALSGPVALEFEGKTWSLSAREILALLAVEFKVGLAEPTVSLKEEPLKALVERIAKETDQPKTNARFDWNNGSLKQLRAGQDGRKVDTAAALQALREAISGEKRVVPLPVAVDKAAGAGIDPSALGIKDRIEFGRTTVTGVPEKVHNIKLAASRLNGVLLAPGDLFSFNIELGPTTLKAGFQTGVGIVVTSGQMETVPSVAGGICQVATTLLHAVFHAGYQLEERYPHLYWIPNYGRPPKGLTGLDATVEDPVLDLKFLNNTSDYLLIQSKVEGNTLEFALYGTKPDWKVEIEGPIITNVVKADPKTVRQEEPSWAEGREVWVESATDGMDVEIIRRVTKDGEVRTLRLKSHYQPSRNVVLVGSRKPDPTPTPPPTPGPAPTAGGAPTAAPSAGTPAAVSTPAPRATATPTPRPPAPGATPTSRPPAPGATPSPTPPRQ